MVAALLVALLAAATPSSEMLPVTATQPALSVRHLAGKGEAVLYVHGATFPARSSIFYRIDGRSWGDDLVARGFDVWGFDLAGYGDSGRPAAMAATSGAPVGRSEDVALQIERVVRHIIAVRGGGKVRLIAHSWGTIPAGRFTAEHPELVERLVLFGPVAQRNMKRDETNVPALQVSAQDQWDSFQSGVPEGEASPIDPAIFKAWADDYLATDPHAAKQSPPSVRVPSGPQADIDASWSGRFPYDPARIAVPTSIVRGAWDAVCKDEDAAWLVAQLRGVPGGARDVVLPRGAHRMHLETNRQALFDAVGAFLIAAP